MLDTKTQADNWIRFRQGLRNSLASATGAKRDQIDVLRTVFWFSEIKRILGADTAYAVEREFEPEAFGKNMEGDSYHRNKWPKYEIGRHVPNAALAAKVNKRFPGMARLLNHVLWESLRTKHAAMDKANDWLQQLTPEFQNIVYERGSFGTGRDYVRAKIGRARLLKLERHAGIEALACLTILLRESHELGDSQSAMSIGQSLYRVLLTLFTTTVVRPIAPELFETYRLRIFPLAQHEGETFCLDNVKFSEAVRLLRCLLLQLEDTYQIGVAWEESSRAMAKLLRGGYGWDVKFAFDPPIAPTEERTSENEDIWIRAEEAERLRQWGLNNIKLGGKERWPPDELW